MSGGKPSSGPGGPITVSIGHITNHEEGDIRKIVLREFQGLANDLDRMR